MEKVRSPRLKGKLKKDTQTVIDRLTKTTITAFENELRDITEAIRKAYLKGVIDGYVERAEERDAERSTGPEHNLETTSKPSQLGQEKMISKELVLITAFVLTCGALFGGVYDLVTSNSSLTTSIAFCSISMLWFYIQLGKGNHHGRV